MSSLVPSRLREALVDRGPDLRGEAGLDTDVEGRLLKAGIVLTVVAVLGQTLVHMVNLLAFDLSIDTLNAGRDGSVFTWASVVVTFAAGVMAALLAGLRPRHAPLLLGLAAALVFLSFDDSFQVHEKVSTLKDQLGPITEFSRTFWPLVYLPLLAGVLLALALLAAGMRPRVRTVVVTGLGLLVAAILLEMASPLLFLLGQEFGDVGYETEVAVEEGAELGGWMLILLGLAVTVCTAAGGRAERS